MIYLFESMDEDLLSQDLITCIRLLDIENGLRVGKMHAYKHQ